MHLVIFDCDGTLVDSQHMIVAAMNGAFAAAGRPALPREQVLSIVGLSLPMAVAALIPDGTRDEVEAITDGYRQAFQQLSKDPEHQEPLYPGIPDLLTWLAKRDDVLLGVATGKSRRGVDRIVARHGLEGMFITVQTADTHPSKPHPSMIETALGETGAHADRAVMIGDTSFDMEMSRAAGVTAFGVSWGYHPVGELKRSGAHAVFDTADALRGALEARF
jgi:phosphoglycolate phosphatase